MHPAAGAARDPGQRSSIATQSCYEAWVETRDAIEKAFRQEAGPVLATLIRLFGDFDRAEEALQEAFLAALETWTAGSIPDRPGAWLVTSARRKGIDRLRREKTVNSKQSEVAALALLEAGEREAMDVQDESVLRDDLLRLICCCCNPALAREARIALTLRTVCGLTTGEIARSFLVPEATMAQRLVRAKKKIRLAGIPYKVPGTEDLPERLESIMAVIYFIFNEGYFASTTRELIRGDLCDEAIHLARTLVALVPEQAETEGLLALLLLQDSRREARVTDAGELVILSEQDRSLWRRDAIIEGQALVKEALGRSGIGPYQIQAAIAAVHSEASDSSQTDWAQIAGLYQRLRELGDSPVLKLNQIVAVSMLKGPATGLAMLEPLEPELDDYQSFHAARADFHRQQGQYAQACAAYERALRLSENPIVARYCQRRIDECTRLST